MNPKHVTTDGDTKRVLIDQSENDVKILDSNEYLWTT